MLAHLLLAALATAGAGPASAQTPGQGQGRDEDMHWRMPLVRKAEVIQQSVYQRHWIEGTYPSLVVVPSDGGPVDYSTEGACNIAHSVTWTGCYLMGAAFRYGWAKEHGTPQDVEAALDLGGQIVNGLYMLTHVSGTPGFVSRGIAYGYGPTYEERGGSANSDAWAQGVGRYAGYRFRTNPSHHNYDHTTRGLSAWYYFLNKYNPNPTGRAKAEMDSVRSMLTEIMNYGYKSRDLVVMDYDGTVSTTLLGAAEGRGRPSTRSLMVTNALTYGGWITGDPWYTQKLQQLVRDHDYLAPGAADSLQSDYDDMEHVIGGLWLAGQIEQDPQLKAFYRAAATTLFRQFATHRRAYYNYMYADLTGDVAGADIPGALQTLQEYPAVTLLYPIMNTIRTDIQFAPPTLREPAERVHEMETLPFYDSPIDNEYDWKSNPHHTNGWLARPVSSLAVSGESPMVWFLGDGTPTLYQTLDGGATFAVNDYRGNGKVRGITFAGNKTRIAFMATDDGIYRTTEGGNANITNIDYFPRVRVTWERVDIGAPGSAPRQVIVDRANPNVIWAVMDDGIYRSGDFGRDQIGVVWEKVSSPLPPGTDVVYGLATGREPAMYASVGGRLYRSTPQERTWTGLPPTDLARLGAPRQIAVVPDKPDTVLFLFGMTRGTGSISFVVRSVDGGRTIQGAGQGTRGMMAALESSGIGRADITSIAIDPNNPQNVYAASSRGFLRSADGGAKWTVSNSGLRIPFANAVYAPREAPGTLFCSTPAGLHVSTDGGRTWSHPVLALNGPGVDRVDRGGMGYLTAYWPGRYFGYVTDRQVTEPPTAWGW